MPLGHLLWVSWICFLLFDGSSGLPAIKGYGYPYIADSRNIGDVEDEELILPTFDQRNWQASNNQLTDPVYANYNKHLAAQQPDWVPSQQNLPNTSSAPDVERLINGDPRDWGLDDVKPLLFPLSPDYQPSTPAMPTNYAGPPAYYGPAPSSTSQATKSPSLESWQLEPDGSGYGVVDFNTDSSAAGGDSSYVPYLAYEDIFQYPSENPEPSQSYGALSDAAEGYGQANHMSEVSSTGYASTLEEWSFPSYPTNVGAQPVYPSEMGSPSSSFPGVEDLNSGQTDYQPRDEISWSQQKPVASTQTAEVSQRLSDFILPPSYIVQSRNGYQRRRSGDTFELPPPLPVNSNGVKDPAPSQPDAPKEPSGNQQEYIVQVAE